VNLAERETGTRESWVEEFFNDSIFGFSTLPSVEVVETEAAYLMEVELPGLTDHGVEVKREGSLLTISSRDGSISFRRSFVVPKEVYTDRITWEFMNDVLVLHFPRREK